METKTWLDAALEVLKLGGQLSARDILNEIEKRQIRPISGKTPEATIGAVLYTSIQDGDTRVKLVGSGLFEFGENSSPPPAKVLGRLENVDPREIWPDEARDFTPWMLHNASYLGEVLGIEIELEAREHPIGPYYLDLFGQDLSNQCVLIVENQLTPTDHRHLGQLLTYAAGTQPQAGSIVWIAPKFRDEHRDALDFLNSRVSGDFNNQIRFFGVEMSVVRIGSSIPAPQFTVVASPSGWNQQLAEVRAAASGGGKAQAYRAFWAQFLVELDKKVPQATKVRSAPAASWITANYLRRGISLNMAFINGGLLSAEIYIDLGNRTRNLDAFYALKDNEELIAKELGESVLWEDLPGRRACRIRVTRPGEILKTETHAELITWLISQQLNFKKVFRSLVDDMPSEIWDREITEENSDVNDDAV
jgi:hypothetical protein